MFQVTEGLDNQLYLFYMLLKFSKVHMLSCEVTAQVFATLLWYIEGDGKYRVQFTIYQQWRSDNLTSLRVLRVNIEVVGGWNKLFEDTRLKRVEGFEFELI